MTRLGYIWGVRIWWSYYFFIFNWKIIVLQNFLWFSIIHQQESVRGTPMFDGVIFHDLVWNYGRESKETDVSVSQGGTTVCMAHSQMMAVLSRSLQHPQWSSGTLSTEALVSLDRAPLSWKLMLLLWMMMVVGWLPQWLHRQGIEAGGGYKARGKSGGVQSGPRSICEHAEEVFGDY